MNTIVEQLLLRRQPERFIFARRKTSSAQYVASRVRDAVFEKVMDKYKHLVKIFAVQDLILANRSRTPRVSLNFLSRISQNLRLNPTAVAYLRRFPYIFDIYRDHATAQPYCKMTETALEIARQEADAIGASLPAAVDRLVRILSMSLTKSVPLRAVFKVWRELGFPDDFEDSIIGRNPHLFRLREGNEPNTHVLMLVADGISGELTAAVDEWRIKECCSQDFAVDRTAIRYAFKHQYPPCMKLTKKFKDRVQAWQRLPYVGPYDELGEAWTSKQMTKELEKRAVAVAHEFLSLTVEKTVEVEKISQFRKSFGIGFNIRDLFLDYPVYEARRRLHYLVMMGRRGSLRNTKSEDGCNAIV